MSYSEPLVTAVIPVYNHEKYVVESIKSIIDQTYPNVELIIINDGSKDESHERVLTLVEECKQRFARFEYINRENWGLSATLNQALEMSKGKYFSGLASDDVALPDKFSVLVEALESRDESYAAVFGNALFIDDQGLQVWLSEKELVCPTEGTGTYSNYLDFRTNRGRVLDYRGIGFGSFFTLLAHNYLPAMSNLVRTELIRQAGAWTDGNASEDWEMWRKLSKKYQFAYIDKPLALYRWHDSNSVKLASDKLKLCSLRLLMNEKQYCKDTGLVPFWRKAYVSLLLPVLLDKRIAFSEKRLAIDHFEVPYLSFDLAKRIVRRAARATKR